MLTQMMSSYDLLWGRSIHGGCSLSCHTPNTSSSSDGTHHPLSHLPLFHAPTPNIRLQAQTAPPSPAIGAVPTAPFPAFVECDSCFLSEGCTVVGSTFCEWAVGCAYFVRAALAVGCAPCVGTIGCACCLTAVLCMWGVLLLPDGRVVPWGVLLA